jgi:hypothetical protein
MTLCNRSMAKRSVVVARCRVEQEFDQTSKIVNEASSKISLMSAPLLDFEISEVRKHRCCSIARHNITDASANGRIMPQR